MLARGKFKTIILYKSTNVALRTILHNQFTQDFEKCPPHPSPGFGLVPPPSTHRQSSGSDFAQPKAGCGSAAPWRHPGGPQQGIGALGPVAGGASKKGAFQAREWQGIMAGGKRWLQEMMGQKIGHPGIFWMQARYQSQYQEVQRWHLRQAPAVGTANLCENCRG